MKNTTHSPGRTRLLTQRECLSRAAILTAAALWMVVAFVLDWRSKEHEWPFLAVAALLGYFAQPWWRYFLLLRRGNRTTGFNFLGIVSMQRTVTTTITVSDADTPRVPAVVSVMSASLLTAAALGWAAVSVAILASARSSGLDRLSAGTMDVIVGAVTVHCWRRVGEDLRPRPPVSDGD